MAVEKDQHWVIQLEIEIFENSETDALYYETLGVQNLLGNTTECCFSIYYTISCKTVFLLNIYSCTLYIAKQYLNTTLVLKLQGLNKQSN